MSYLVFNYLCKECCEVCNPDHQPIHKRESSYDSRCWDCGKGWDSDKRITIQCNCVPETRVPPKPVNLKKRTGDMMGVAAANAAKVKAAKDA